MKLIPGEFLDYRNTLVSENRVVFVGLYKVMFGWRVRAGYCRDTYLCELDWCAGANWNDVERLYSLAVAILSKKEENHSCFKDMPPFSNIKPFFNDAQFTYEVCKMAGEDFKMIHLPKPEDDFDLSMFNN